MARRQERATPSESPRVDSDLVDGRLRHAAASYFYYPDSAYGEPELTPDPEPEPMDSGDDCGGGSRGRIAPWISILASRPI